ncbi:hypothetical protein AYI68_g1071 [Smittium mucronatum]|uniref:Uncharacterized protein n=1 Tax=Smittium mucronatum TaxID=133383 RepID=A0A1R0H6P7_9FUNG|nr:hypothetical protein AYI68_g1071 [Smittium mucronatum]
MPEDTEAKLNELTSLLKRLLRERKPQLEIEDPFLTTISPATNLYTDYQDDRLLRAPLDPGNPRTHNRRPTNSVCKKNESPTVRIAATVTKKRLDNLHKSLDLPEKPQHLVESDKNSLVEQEKPDALIASKNPEQRSIIRKPFRKRQKAGAQNSTISKPSPAQNTEAAVPSTNAKNHPHPSKQPCTTKRLGRLEEKDGTDPSAAATGAVSTNVASATSKGKAQQRGPPNPDVGDGLIAYKEGYIIIKVPGSGILHQAMLSPINRGTQTCPGPEKAELARLGAEIQDRVARIYMPNDQEEGLHIDSRIKGYFHAHPDSQVLKENQVGEVFDDAIIFDNPSWYDYRFPGHESQGPFNQDPGPPQRSERTVETWQDDVEMPGELYLKSSSHFSCHTTGLTHVETRL